MLGTRASAIDNELSGYDNIRIRGLILGLNTREIEEDGGYRRSLPN